MNTHTQQILERFNKKFDGMHDYENDTIYNEKETKEKLKDFITSELSTLENAVREQAFEDGRKSAFNEALELSVEQMNKKIDAMGETGYLSPEIIKLFRIALSSK